MPSLLDLILLDLIMPVMDGVEVASHVRNSSELRQIKIIVVSANTSLSNQKQMAKIGCDGFIAKPIHIDVLLNRLCLHLDLEWIFDASSESPPEALPLVFPPQEDLEILLDLAKGGYVTDIRKTLARLKETEPELVPFVSRLEDMASSFQFKQIIELIMSAKNQ